MVLVVVPVKCVICDNPHASEVLGQMALIRSQQTARQKLNLRTLYGVKETPNALLELPLDLHRYGMHV